MHSSYDYRLISNNLRLIIFVVGGIEGSCFKLIFSKLKFQFSIFSTDDVELANHIIMIDQMLRVEIEG